MKVETNKAATEGWSVYTLVSIANGRPARIPEDIIQKYTV